MTEKMKVWVTKYALTRGITEHEAHTTSTRPQLVCLIGAGYQQHLRGNEWHVTRELAIRRAEQMRSAKIASMRRRIAVLETLRFE